VLDLCGGNRDLARRAWDKFGGDLAAVDAAHGRCRTCYWRRNKEADQ